MHVEATALLKKPKHKILQLIREPGSLLKYHPYCKRNKAIQWPGNNSIDELEYLNGLTFSRNFFNWSDDGYDLEIGSEKKMALVNWIVEGDINESTLRVRINPQIENYIPYKNKFIQKIIWFFFIKPKLQSYINSVISGLKYYIKTKKQVTPNQFGEHKWFS